MPKEKINPLLEFNKNLTTEQRREIARRAGRASAAKKKEDKEKRRFLSQIFADMIIKDYTGGDGTIKAGGEKFEEAALEILDRKDSASVSLMKLIVDVTEGTKQNINLATENDGNLGIVIEIAGANTTAKSRPKATKSKATKKKDDKT